MDLEKALNQIQSLILDYGPKLIGAIIVWIIGSYIIKHVTRAFNRLMDKKKTDPSLKSFFKNLVNVILKILLIFSVLGMLGVEMTSFIALLGAAGLAVGMALSGTLQNFAGGVIILLFKPFKIGDYLEAQGHEGIVKEIQLFNTIITTLDNKTIIIPNGGLSTGTMVNYSTEPLRRVDFSFGIAYGDDLKKAKSIIQSIIDSDERMLKKPEPFIALGELGDSSVNITVRVWVKNADYWDIFFFMNENVYEQFNQNDINIPFPQMDVHLHKSE